MLEKIQILLTLFYWFMGGVAALLIIIGRFIWGIFQGLNNVNTTNATRDEKIKQLRDDHQELKQYVYHKN